MEQYWMPKKLDIKNLRACIRHYSPELLFIRAVGSMGGDVKVRENLQGKKLGFKKDKSGLSIHINRKEVFHFPLKDYDKGFSLSYERIEATDDGVGKMLMLQTGVDPYDPKLPEPTKSILRSVLDGHLMEIVFTGRVHLNFHSWWWESHWKYWVVERPNPIQEAIAKRESEYADDDAGNSHS